MRFTDVFVHRPVLASVVSLLILVLGARAVFDLEIREYPEAENTVVSVTTAYPGASSELVQGFITTPLQQAIAEAEGIDYLSATSSQGRSVIEAQMELDYDSKDAVAEIQAKVASQQGNLPRAARDPVIEASAGDQDGILFLAFFSDVMTPPQVTDYLLRVVQPQIQAVPGVAQAELRTGATFAMRVWLNPERMAALNVTANEVRAALQENNYLASPGQSKGAFVTVNLSTTTDATTVEDFENLVIRRDGDTIIRLSDVARPELGSENYDFTARYRDNVAVLMAIQQTPGANPLTVAQSVRGMIPDIRGQLPEGINLEVAYDASVYIEDSIDEVFRTLGEAVLIVLGIVFVTLGSWRAAVVPAVAVPLSLVGGAFLMLLMGFSINLLTLLAFVLAIGLVVDDAIVVVENVHRHIERGESRFNAAIMGARELALPIIAMTTTLVAVYAPIGFMGGLVGKLFTEFAYTLAGTVLISGVVALTLSPMLSGKVLKAERAPTGFEGRVERFFNGLADKYQHTLHGTLDYVSLVIVAAVVILVSIYFMFTTAQSELAPAEDRGILFFQGSAPETATIAYDEAFVDQIETMFKKVPEYDQSFYFIGAGGDPSSMQGAFKMPPVAERREKGMRGQAAVQAELQQKLSSVAGLDLATFPLPTLPGSGFGFPIQFVMLSDASYAEMSDVADGLIERAMQSGNFAFLQKSLAFDRPRTTIVIDRDRAGAMGISMAQVGEALSTLLGEGEVNRFNLEGRSYRVIPQVAQRFRLDAEMISDYYIRAGDGELVPLSSLVSFEKSVEPSQRTQFQRLNSLTVQGLPRPGVTLGDALTSLQNLADETFPASYTYDYSGQSRQYVQQGTALVTTFFLALLVIYLVLAAQFESWRDPVIILVSVPMSIAGAMAFLTLGFATINIYTQVGLITLIGLIAKNGILIVEFANQLQIREGLDKRAAVEKAAAIRLRPILMTTMAMVMAMIPLLTATGSGATSRFHIGLVIAAGLGIGTVFTLFVVPAVYLLLARRHERAAEEDASAAASPSPA